MRFCAPPRWRRSARPRRARASPLLLPATRARSQNSCRKPATTGLFCYQDCVGGSLHFEADGKALIVVLDGRDGVRLRQDLQPAVNATRLRLEPAPASACRSIEDHYFKE